MTGDTAWSVPTPTPEPETDVEQAPAGVAAVEHPEPYVPDGQPQWLHDIVSHFHGRLGAVERALAEAGVAVVKAEL